MVHQKLFDICIPPLPSYTLSLRPDLLPWISDVWLSLVAPVIVYWVLSLIFHVIDIFELFPQYRLHAPEEITKRNHASRYEVARDVIMQQIIQVTTGAVLSPYNPPEMIGRAEYDIAIWATRIRLAQSVLPSILGVFGLDAAIISKNLADSYPSFSGAIAGGYYHSATGNGWAAFASWEMTFAKAIYYAFIPPIQFFIGIFMIDTWEYFLHRLMHMNTWLYTTLHSRHHRLYVPYAYGALYNHPLEGFLLETVGGALAFKATSMSLRQGMWFWTFCTIKTVDDHCGYSFPWDPLQLLTGNNAAYHDIHHQPWGIKTNFSQPFFTFWDTIFDTKYKSKRVNKTNALRGKKDTEKEKKAVVEVNGN